MKAVLLTFAALWLLASPACGGSDDTNALKAQVAALQTQVAQPAPDRVVGIERKCLDVTDGNDTPMGFDICTRFWETFSQVPSVRRSLRLTIRTAFGTTYTLDVLRETQVAIGDEWPPK